MPKADTDQTQTIGGATLCISSEDIEAERAKKETYDYVKEYLDSLSPYYFPNK